MTTAQFEDRDGGDVSKQALTCFRQLKSLLGARGGRISATKHMVVEVTRSEDIDTVGRVRAEIFGHEHPAMVSTRTTRLPQGQRVRVTVTV
jgi:enamine deaminase RidA (YjgF/YER057c/UK114 family)